MAASICTNISLYPQLYTIALLSKQFHDKQNKDDKNKDDKLGVAVSRSYIPHWLRIWSSLSNTVWEEVLEM